MSRFKIYPLLALLVVLFASSCEKTDEVPNYSGSDTTNLKIYSLFKSWYFWQNEVPDLNATVYEDPYELLEAMRFKPTDRWSFIQDEESYDQLFLRGESVGYGIGFKVVNGNELMVSFAYPGSPADLAGFKRGLRVMKINDKDTGGLLSSQTIGEELGPDEAGFQARFSVVDQDGAGKDITVAKANFPLQTIIHKQIYDLGDQKVGYLVYNSFLNSSETDLLLAFQDFAQQGINALVLDLRYNGGGSLGITQRLASMLLPPANLNREFLELTYNSLHQNQNYQLMFENPAVYLNLDKFVVLTSGSTASASEAIINGMKPYLDVVTVGTQTAGKPVGMNTFKIDGYAVLPVTFKLANSAGTADYYDGILADIPALDDPKQSFGAHDENMLSAALEYIRTGLMDARLDKSVDRDKPVLEYEGLRMFTQSY
jgi:C-terminal processing protease CtpA/Prc